MHLTDLLHAVDAHAEGEATRVVVGGLPRVAGATMAEKRQALRADDRLRRYLLGEPRGHIAIHAVCLFPPSDSAADAGMVIMEATEYPAMSGSNAICAATVLLETGMVPLDVPGLGEVRVDVAWGGAFFALVDVAAFGLELVPAQAGELAALGRRITAAAAAQLPVVHPERPDLHTVTFTTFTGPPQAGGDGRNATVIKPGRLDRSACGTATSARLAVLHARGELGVGEDYVHESIASTTFTGRIEGLTRVGSLPAVRPSISGRAWITGVHQLGRDPRDPLGRGFALADTWLGAEQWATAGDATTV